MIKPVQGGFAIFDSTGRKRIVNRTFKTRGEASKKLGEMEGAMRAKKREQAGR